MKLTKKEAIKRHRELWGWLAENPMKDKLDWPGWERYDAALNDCFLCEYTSDKFSKCEHCPVWFKENGFNRGSVPYCLGGLFYGWATATLPEERKRLAALIRDLPEKKDEAELKVEDKVVPIGISWENWTLEKYLNFPSRIPAFLREKGYLRVSKINNDKYHCGTDSFQGLEGLDEVLESELIPYIETPKYHAPQNYSCRDIVVNQYDRETIYNGPATICIINLGGKDYKGIAKCAPDDTFNERFGQGLAETRALIKAYRDIERRLITKASQSESEGGVNVLNKLRDEIHQNAVEYGWWEETVARGD